MFLTQIDNIRNQFENYNAVMDILEQVKDKERSQEAYYILLQVLPRVSNEYDEVL